jgi:hypothetical protein
MTSIRGGSRRLDRPLDLLAAIEQSVFAKLLKASFYIYPTVSALHIAAIGTLFATVWLMDLRVAGAFAKLPEEGFVDAMRKVALGAFAISVLSGLVLFSVRATEYAAMPIFLAKMALIVLAGINLGLFVLASGGPWRRARHLRRLFAGVSATIWTVVVLVGRFVGFN